MVVSTLGGSNTDQHALICKAFEGSSQTRQYLRHCEDPPIRRGRSNLCHTDCPACNALSASDGGQAALTLAMTTLYYFLPMTPPPSFFKLVILIILFSPIVVKHELLNLKTEIETENNNDNT